ncbi:hypothetical protein ADJ76_06485 [Schaalia meyeri]|nr:hypothetical protein ADJ76_06485 [Schaalia meyeri]OFQ23302.1 hypothetical protein HMPREF2946_07950 [Actinomyces sp. HMSC062G12]
MSVASTVSSFRFVAARAIPLQACHKTAQARQEGTDSHCERNILCAPTGVSLGRAEAIASLTTRGLLFHWIGA